MGEKERAIDADGSGRRRLTGGRRETVRQCVCSVYTLAGKKEKGAERVMYTKVQRPAAVSLITSPL